MTAGQFVGYIYCPTCGEKVTMSAGVSTSGVSRDGSLLRVQTTDATARHSCKGDK